MLQILSITPQCHYPLCHQWHYGVIANRLINIHLKFNINYTLFIFYICIIGLVKSRHYNPFVHYNIQNHWYLIDNPSTIIGIS